VACMMSGRGARARVRARERERDGVCGGRGGQGKGKGKWKGSYLSRKRMISFWGPVESLSSNCLT